MIIFYNYKYFKSLNMQILGLLFLFYIEEIILKMTILFCRSALLLFSRDDYE